MDTTLSSAVSLDATRTVVLFKKPPASLLTDSVFVTARVIALASEKYECHIILFTPSIHTHTHTHTLSSPRSRKGCLRKRGTRSRRCVHNNTQRHNNIDAESHSPNLIHRVSFTEPKFECRTRVAEGTSAGRSTLRHNRTHAPTGPRRARTYMRI